MTLFLSGTVGGQFLVWPLEAERLMIGRSSRNAVQLADATVSKEHAEITVEAGQARLRDLGSRNGTRVNGIEAREPLPIKPGDRLEVGHVQLQVTPERPTRPLALAESAIVGSSHHIRFDQVLERRTRTSAGARSLVQILAKAGQLLVLPRPLQETCDQILEVIAEAVPASRYVVLLRDKPDSDPVQIAARMKESATRQPMMLSSAIMRTVMDECSSVVTADASEDTRFRAQQSIVAQTVHSAMAVPLFDNEQVLGLIYVDRQEAAGPFTEEHVELLTLLANMAAVKIKNARLLEAEQAALQVTQQLEYAARTQRGLLPKRAPEVAGWQFEAFLESCYAVGGDFYDFHHMADGRVRFLVGDVSGKGVGAAMLTFYFLSAARVLYETCPDLTDLATRLSVALHHHADAGSFVTGLVGTLDPATGRLEYVNAGHPAPIVVVDGAIQQLEATGIPFGILPEFPYTKGSIELPKGALVAIFSDGIPEAQHGEEFFDEERLRDVVREAAALPDLESVRQRIVGTVDAFMAGEHRTDDLTLLLLRRNAA